MMKSRRWLRRALLLALSVALASCGNDPDNDTAFRLIQASPDLPLVNLLVDDVVLRAAIDYRGGPGFLTVTPRTYKFGIEASVVGQDGLFINVPIVQPVQTSLEAGTEYTLVSIGKAATGTVQPLIIENPIEAVPGGNARLQFVHAAPDVPAVVDIYLTTVPASPSLLPELSTQTPIAQVTYGQQPAPRQLVLPGTYVIRVAVPGATEPVFVSNEITLSDGNDFLIVAVNNISAGLSPISLAVNSGFRAFFNPVGTFDIFDKDALAELRVVQVSPDAPALDIIGIGDSGLEPERTFATGLTYLADTGYVPTVPDTYTVRGVPSSDPGTATPLFTITGTLPVAVPTTLFTTGLVDNIDPLVLPGDIRPVFAQGKLRIVDASPSSDTVDVYILAAGTDFADPAVTPTLQNLALRSATPYLPFFPRNYTVTFTVAGTKTVLAAAEVAATEGTVQTAILVDAVRVDSSSDGKPPAVLLTNDLADQ